MHPALPPNFMSYSGVYHVRLRFRGLEASNSSFEMSEAIAKFCWLAHAKDNDFPWVVARYTSKHAAWCKACGGRVWTNPNMSPSDLHGLARQFGIVVKIVRWVDAKVCAKDNPGTKHIIPIQFPLDENSAEYMAELLPPHQKEYDRLVALRTAAGQDPKPVVIRGSSGEIIQLANQAEADEVDADAEDYDTLGAIYAELQASKLAEAGTDAVDDPSGQGEIPPAWLEGYC